MTESSAGPALSAAERQAAEVLLAQTVIPDYPALAQPGSAPADVPDWRHPNL